MHSKKLRVNSLYLIIFASLLVFSRSGTALAQWSTPVRISDRSMLTPRAVAVGESLHVVAWGDSGHFRYIRSTDGGHSWNVLPTPADSFYGAGTPDIIYSKGLLHILWIGYILAPWQYHIYHCSSSDGGNSWSIPHRAFPHGIGYLAYPRLAANGDTLLGGCAVEDRYLFFRSLDAGESWQDSVEVEPGPANTGYYPSILRSGERLLMVMQLSFSSDSLGEEVYCRASDDWGLSWGERVILSTPEPIPDYRHSQFPSAYADENGNIVVAWFDYKYGSMCGYSGDILARISRDGGVSWGSEQRLTYTQSGEASSCLIWNDTVYIAWMDNYPLGCTHPKICYSASGDWGEYWNWPQVISGMEPVGDLEPVIFHSPEAGDSVYHCIFRSHFDFEPSYIYYMRGRMEITAIEDEEPPIPEEIQITAYPNPFNSSTIIAYSNLKGGEIGIYDIQGKRLKILASEGGGDGKIKWDATDASGKSVSSGVYFARAAAPQQSQTLKLIYLK